MTGEVARGKLGQRGVACQGWRSRDPVVEQREGVLLAAAAGETDRALHRQPAEDVQAARVAGVYAPGFERLVKRAALEPPAAFERSRQDLAATRHHGRVDAHLALDACGIARQHARRE